MAAQGTEFARASGKSLRETRMSASERGFLATANGQYFS
jgi:hypothetical protein